MGEIFSENHFSDASKFKTLKVGTHLGQARNACSTLRNLENLQSNAMRVTYVFLSIDYKYRSAGVRGSFATSK